MQVSVENVGNLGRKLTVRIPATRLEDTVRNRVQEMGRSARLKGFRVGKVPTKVIEQRFGAQIRGEAMSELINSTFQEAISSEKLRPAVQPSITTSGATDNDQFEYVATFEVMPEIGTVDVSGLEITRQVATVGDADIDQMIDTLRMQRRSWSPVVERGALEDDMVLFELAAEGEGFRHPETGTDRVGTIIGSGALFKEIEDALVGHKVDDEFSASFDFPADFRIAALAGKTAATTMKIVGVQEPKVPELDDAFVASFGVSEGGLERFKEDVRANLERELASALNMRLKASTVEKLVDANADIELPQGMIEAEARDMARRSTQGKEEVSHEPFLTAARRRVAGGLLLAEISRQNDISVDTGRVVEALSAIASTYEQPGEVIELYRNDPQLMSGLQSQVLEDQVVAWIAEHAKVTDQTMSFNEVMRPGG